MKTLTRTCGTCAAFNRDQIDDLPACWNLIVFTARDGTREPLATDTGCEQHQTCEESATVDELVCVADDGQRHAAVQAAALAVATVRKARA